MKQKTPPVDGLTSRSDLPSPRQTLSFLKKIFSAYGLEAKSKLGQNYLIDLNLIDFIARSAELDSQDAVLEVGTGTGSLTARLAADAGMVVTIEIDTTFQPVSEELVGPRPNVRFLRGDCLAKKSLLNPEMMAAWESAMAEPGRTRRKVVANLPYVIATPLISNLLVFGPSIDTMVVMVQWEIAERMIAVAGTKDYNALSILIQSVADVEILRKVAPTNFFPMPNVDSAIIRIKPNIEKRNSVGDVLKFRDFLRDLYIHRRKHLRVALIGSPRGRRNKDEVDAKLQELNIDSHQRAEMLSIEDHLRLCQVFG